MIQLINYRDHQLHCFIEGSGDPIVFLHGWPSNSRLWKAQVNTFKTSYKTITLDWLGFGLSDKPTDHHYTFTHKVEMLDAALSKVLEKHEKVTIVAHDIGGPPAILWASEHPERMKRLILLNTVIYPFKTTMDSLSHVLFTLPLVKNIFASQFGLRQIMKTNTRSNHAALNERIRDILSVYKNVAQHIKLKTILEPLDEGRKNEVLSLSDKFKQLSIAKYLIIAKEDPLCYKHIQHLQQENPDVPHYYIQKCGHYMPIDRPKKLNDVLKLILEGNDLFHQKKP